MKLIGLLGCLSLASWAVACRWDRDTLVNEATKMPDVIETAVGRFPRNPPLFYQMRIQRETAGIAKDPTKLELYDDVAVAYDVLGDDDQAISWIEKKHRQMGDLSRATTGRVNLDSFSEAAYRYYANAGTFWVHRWMKRGAKEGDLSQAEHARDLIAAAIKINPNAHFGREVVQLAVIEWLIQVQSGDGTMSLGDYLYFEVRNIPGKRQENLNKWVKGAVGLIVLGNAWESPDMFGALAKLVDEARYTGLSKIGIFVRQRQLELLHQGHKPLWSPKGGDSDVSGHYGDGSRIVSEFHRLREEADSWQKDRTDFMMVRLKAGRHPDTDPYFWDGYVSKPAPQVYYPFWETLRPETIIYMELVTVLSSPFILFFIVRRVKQRRKNLRIR